MKVRVVPPEAGWRADFESEAERIRSVLRGVVVAIHHIGSTSIPGIYSKPIVDILVEVDDVAALAVRTKAMVELGYEAKGEFGIPGRRYFRSPLNSSTRRFHVHLFEKGSLEAQRHLAFRDYMIAHPSIAQSYSLLKRHLADEHPEDIEAYMNGKDAFIKEHEAEAMNWRRGMQPRPDNAN